MGRKKKKIDDMILVDPVVVDVRPVEVTAPKRPENWNQLTVKMQLNLVAEVFPEVKKYIRGE